MLKDHLEDEDFKPSMEALTRVINLAKKVEDEAAKINPELFENDAEKALYEATTRLENDFVEQTVEENYKALVSLRPLIEAYFEQTMVMVEDEAVRNNRLLQLRKISKMSLALASLDTLITK
jgi:glycyl-tRNA synthetase beta chain